jgi:hypothetical protein
LSISFLIAISILVDPSRTELRRAVVIFLEGFGQHPKPLIHGLDACPG